MIIITHSALNFDPEVIVLLFTSVMMTSQIGEVIRELVTSGGVDGVTRVGTSFRGY